MILTGVFALFLIGGVAVFSLYRGSSGAVSEVLVWGTISSTDFSEIIKNSPLYQSEDFAITYVQKSAESFDTEFVEALADGAGPDLFMLPSNKVLKHRNKIFPIPYDVLTERQFKDSFIEGAEIYMMPEGVMALPVLVDPLVMYWNRSIFTSAKMTSPPRYWDEFYDLAAAISQKDGALNILRSAVALGEFSNIAHAKEIISNLAMQAGTPVVLRSGSKIESVFDASFGQPTIPAEAAVNFFTEFGNPAKSSYSWNRSLDNSADYFLGGDLALYFGFASEIADIQLKNPNLNFDVTPMPVSREGGVDTSFANFISLAITKSSKNPSGAFSVASILSGAEGALAWSKVLKLPPARRDLLAKKPSEAFQSVFYDSAIRGKAWLDPNPAQTDAVFKNMIESITSGRMRTAEAVARASREISAMLR